MTDCLRIRLRPTGPWRIAPDTGERDRIGLLYHSDTLYSAICSAMLRLGWLEEWIADRDSPPVRLSSLLPSFGETLFVPAPSGLWPPPTVGRLHARAARFLPQAVASAVFAGKALEEDRWEVEAVSQCLLPSSGRGGNGGPFRIALRTGAAVDRVSGAHAEVHRTACLEFAPGAGFWFVAQFRDPDSRAQWEPRLMAAMRLLCDSGFGGRRSIGWGHAELSGVDSGPLTDLVLGPAQEPEPPKPAPAEAEGEAVAEPAPPPAPVPTAWWLLSLFTPAAGDAIDWQRGAYSLVSRSGRVESPQGCGDSKKSVRMVSEGSLLVSPEEPTGCVTDVAPEGFPHPVLRSGFAVCLQVPFRGYA